MSNLTWLVPSLYCFAMLDAFLTAREWNAGVGSRLVGVNPRIAAILNFLTKGFGYFYLGERGKGVIVFVCVSVVQGLLFAFSHNPFLRILAISIQIAIAVDAYRRASHQLLDTNPELHTDAVERANPGSLPSWVPVGVASAVVLGYLAFLGGMEALHGKFSNDAQFAKIDNSPNGNTYSNSHDDIRFTVPAGWSLKSGKKELAVALNQDSTCSIDLLMQYSLGSVPLTLEVQHSLLQKLHPNQSYSQSTTRIGGEEVGSIRTGYTLSSGDVVRHDMVFRRGLRMFTLIEVERNEGCPGEMEGIESSFDF